MQEHGLHRYAKEDGREPFTEWLNGLRDKAAQARIRLRLRRIEAGGFGDCRSIGGGVLEVRVHTGAGYRVYFGSHGASVILLNGSDKASQKHAIENAKKHWAEWKQRQAPGGKS